MTGQFDINFPEAVAAARFAARTVFDTNGDISAAITLELRFCMKGDLHAWESRRESRTAPGADPANIILMYPYQLMVT